MTEPNNTKKCQIKCDTFFFIANGIIPNVYTIPPPRIYTKNIISSVNILGRKITPHHPKTKYSVICNHLNLPAPNTPTNVIPVTIMIHCIIQNTVPNIPPK